MDLCLFLLHLVHLLEGNSCLLTNLTARNMVCFLFRDENIGVQYQMPLIGPGPTTTSDNLAFPRIVLAFLIGQSISTYLS